MEGPQEVKKGRGWNRKERSVVVRKWMADNQGKHFCQCGCGETIVIQIHHSARGIPAFVNHHSVRVKNPMSGMDGEKNPNFNGGRYISQAGYVLVLIPGPGRSEYKLEHRMVVEKALGIFLSDEEVVHHINGDKTDNRVENLEVMLNSEHASLHAQRGDIGFGRMVKIHGKAWKQELFGG